MERYLCPLCGHRNISWSARCSHYLCLTVGCYASAPPVGEVTVQQWITVATTNADMRRKEKLPS